MLKVAIVEDDPLFREELAEFIASVPDVELTDTYGDGEELLGQIQKIRAEILFLDVGLPGMSGIQVAECIRREFPYIEIVFITAEETHIREAFRLYAADFMTKPLNQDRLRQTLDWIRQKLPLPSTQIEIESKGKVVILNQADIYLAEALTKKTIIYTNAGILTCEHSMKDLENCLNKDMFIRTSRSYLVNLRLVEGIKPCSRTSYQILFRGKDYQAYLAKKLYPEFRERIKASQKKEG